MSLMARWPAMSADSPMHQALVPLDRARQMLAECRTIDEIKKVRDMAEAARLYAKKAQLGLDAQNHCAVIKLEAEARAGELLRTMRVNGERHSGGGDQKSESHHATPILTLPDLGLDKFQSARWQKVAQVPEPERLAYVEACTEAGLEATTAGLLKTAHVSHNSGENEWYTPAEYIAIARAVLGEIDLDPASTEEANAVVGARCFYTEEDDGLAREWRGRVWMNPPYAGDLIGPFTAKLRAEYQRGSVVAAAVLVNNATETAWFAHLSEAASAICFPVGRVKFWQPGRASAAPLQGQALMYLGPEPGRFGQSAAGLGRVWR